MSQGKIAGWVMLILGIVGGVYSAITITDDTSQLLGYDYNPPLTSHEVLMLILVCLAVVLIAFGLAIVLPGNNEKS